MDDLNEFKLGNYEVECNHTMIEGWYSYDSYDNLLEIQNFSNVGQTIDNPYEKVLLSLFGGTLCVIFRYWVYSAIHKKIDIFFGSSFRSIKFRTVSRASGQPDRNHKTRPLKARNNIYSV